LQELERENIIINMQGIIKNIGGICIISILLLSLLTLSAQAHFDDIDDTGISLEIVTEGNPHCAFRDCPEGVECAVESTPVSCDDPKCNEGECTDTQVDTLPSSDWRINVDVSGLDDLIDTATKAIPHSDTPVCQHDPYPEDGQNINVSCDDPVCNVGPCINTSDNGRSSIDIYFSSMQADISIKAIDIRGWDKEKKVEFLNTVKTYAEISSDRELDNFATGVLLRDENVASVSLNQEEVNVKPLAKGEILMLNVNSAATVGVVTDPSKKNVSCALKKPICAEKGSRITISRKVGDRFRLIGFGLLK